MPGSFSPNQTKDYLSTLDHDSIYCPMSRQIMRHPVQIFPSGHYYELDYLVKHISANGYFCPKTRIPISSVKYADNLKEILDSAFSNNDDRYEDYEMKPLFAELSQQLYQRNHPARIALKNSLLLTSPALLLLALKSFVYDENETEDHITYGSFLITLAMGSIDCGLRYASNNRFGIFGSFSAVSDFLDERLTVPGYDPDEENILLALRL